MYEHPNRDNSKERGKESETYSNTARTYMHMYLCMYTNE